MESKSNTHLNNEKQKDKQDISGLITKETLASPFVLSDKIKKVFDDCADKTDIWDNERYGKFRNMFLKEVKKLAGDLGK